MSTRRVPCEEGSLAVSYRSKETTRRLSSRIHLHIQRIVPPVEGPSWRSGIATLIVSFFCVSVLPGGAVAATIRVVDQAPYAIILSASPGLPSESGVLADGDFREVSARGALAAVSLRTEPDVVELSAWSRSVFVDGLDTPSQALIGGRSFTADFTLVLDPEAGEAPGDLIQAYLHLAVSSGGFGPPPAAAAAYGTMTISGQDLELVEGRLGSLPSGTQSLPVLVPIGTPFELALETIVFCCLDEPAAAQVDSHYQFSLSPTPPDPPPVIPEPGTVLLFSTAVAGVIGLRHRRPRVQHGRSSNRMGARP